MYLRGIEGEPHGCVEVYSREVSLNHYERETNIYPFPLRPEDLGFSGFPSFIFFWIAVAQKSVAVLDKPIL